MHDSEFEQQVRNRMLQLDLAPAPGIWPEVEKALKKRKRRRVFAYWILAGLLLGGGLIYHNVKNEPFTKISKLQNVNGIAKPQVSQNQTDTISNKPVELKAPSSKLLKNKRTPPPTGRTEMNHQKNPLTIDTFETELNPSIPQRLKLFFSVMPMQPTYKSLDIKKDSTLKEKYPINYPGIGKLLQVEIGLGRANTQTAAQYLSLPATTNQSIRTNSPVSSIPSGYYLGIGGQLSYPISKRLSAVSSVQYQFFSNSLANYTIYNHQLEQKLGLSIDFGYKGKIRWEIALTARHNLNNNEPVLDPSTNTYTATPSIIRKTVWGLSTGMHVPYQLTNGKYFQIGCRYFMDLQPYTTSTHPEKLYRMGLGVYLRK